MLVDAAEIQQRRLTGLTASAVARVADVADAAEETIGEVGNFVVANINDAGRFAVDDIVHRVDQASAMLSEQLQSMLDVVQAGAGGATGFAVDKDGNIIHDPSKEGTQLGGAITYETAHTWLQKYISFQEYLEQKQSDRNPFRTAEAQRGMQEYAALFERFFPQLGRISDLALEMRNMMGRSNRRKLPQYMRPRGPGLRTRFRRSRSTGRI